MLAPRSRSGFTLVELLITVLIMAVLLAVAVPNLTRTMTLRRLSNFTQELNATLAYARSEAVKRGVPVSVCKSSDGTSCTGTWSGGWIIFVNADNDSPAAVDAGGTEPILRVFSALPSGYTLNANSNFTNYLTYDRLGMANNVGTFVFCRSSDETTARAVIVTRTRPRVATDTNGDGIPNREDGSNISSCESPS